MNHDKVLTWEKGFVDGKKEQRRKKRGIPSKRSEESRW